MSVILMIGLSTIYINERGDIVIYELPDSNFMDLTARVSRIATLDGGYVITHSGISHGDRTFQVKADINKDEIDNLKTIFETETIIYISSSEGFFSGVIESMKLDNGILSMTLLLKEKLS